MDMCYNKLFYRHTNANENMGRKLPKDLEEEVRSTAVKISGKELITVQFADDQVIITEIRENVEIK